MPLAVRRVGPATAGDMLTVIHAAFARRPELDPPADALVESAESLGRKLQGNRGVVALDQDGIAGCLVVDPVGDGVVFLRRFAVRPDAQGNGVGSAMLTAAEEVVVEVDPSARELRVLARAELPDGVAHWLSHGFQPCGEPTPYVELRRPLPVRSLVSSADEMRAHGHALAGTLSSGDLVLLIGELGAGKTTWTQGLGEGLGVRGAVTSPTFVISRIHPSLAEGPALVHVDAYRLGDEAELDSLDLDASLDAAVTVVEWGRGIAEELSESRVEVEIRRAVADDDTGENDSRVVLVRRVGPRWHP